MQWILPADSWRARLAQAGLTLFFLVGAVANHNQGNAAMTAVFAVMALVSAARLGWMAHRSSQSVDPDPVPVPAEAVRDVPRRSVAMSLLVAIVPGWSILSGVALAFWLGAASTLAQIAMPSGVVIAILVQQFGARVLEPDTAPPATEGITWFTGMASQWFISRRRLTLIARASRLPSRPLITVCWAPWWALAAFWVLLVAHALAALVS